MNCKNCNHDEHRHMSKAYAKESGTSRYCVGEDMCPTCKHHNIRCECKDFVPSLPINNNSTKKRNDKKRQ